MQSLNIHEVDLYKLKCESFIIQASDIIENLLKKDQSKYKYLINIILNLETIRNETFKCRLIGILRESINNPLFLADILPNIHNFLFDVESTMVRCEGVKFVEYLIENHPQIVTQTLIDTIKIFLEDPDTGVRGYTIEAFGSIITNFPEQVEKNQLYIIINAITDKYVFVHKKATRLSYKIFPFIDDDQKYLLLNGIMALEKIYFKENDIDFCERLISILLFITKERPSIYNKIVKNHIVKYCNSDEYYTAVKALKRLTHIREQASEFNDLWLQQALLFLEKTQPDHSSLDYRNDLFEAMYELSQDVIKNHIQEISNFIKQRISLHHFSDVFQIYGILGFYNLHNELIEFTIYFRANVDNNKSNEYSINQNEVFNKIASLEKTLGN